MNWDNLLFWRKPKLNVVATFDSDQTYEGDQLVLRQLQKLGADLTQPREVRHYFYFPTELARQPVTKYLRDEGYTVNERESPVPSPNPWLALATIRAVVDGESVLSMRRAFEELARLHQGEYDGWEAAPTP
jgi:hypothetical protein